MLPPSVSDYAPVIGLADRELIERFIDPEWEQYPAGPADARLREYGVPVWALIAHFRATGNDRDQLANDYQLPRQAVDAAFAYYRLHKEHIDARIVLSAV